ncbi:MAG: hypothetical protein HYV07_31695 [Deltaproteobacteria bacterium]|nr:hypothetical protein [Deltaproteobacteria bacterium]
MVILAPGIAVAQPFTDDTFDDKKTEEPAERQAQPEDEKAKDDREKKTNKKKKKKKKKTEKELSPETTQEEAPAEKKPKKGYKVGVGGVVAGGMDTNTYNRPEKNQTAASAEATAKANVTVPASAISWSSGLSAGGSYRAGEESAAKIKASLKTGITWLVAGNKKLPGGKKVSKKKVKLPALTLGVSAAYAFSANPVSEAYLVDQSAAGLRPAQEDPPPEDPPPEETPPQELTPEQAEEFYAVDPELDEVLDDMDDMDDMDAEDMDDSEDEGGDEEEMAEEGGGDEGEEEGEQEEDFADEDVLAGSSFGLKNPKHKIGGSLKLGLDAWKRGKFSLTGQVSKGIIGVDEGKPSPNYLATSASLRFSQSLSILTLGVGLGLDNRSFDEKVTSQKSENPGAPIYFVTWIPSVHAELKPIKRLKFKLGYRYQARTTDVDANLETFKHAINLMGRFGLTSSFAVFLQGGYGFQGKMVTVDKDSTRLQGVLGVQIKG